LVRGINHVIFEALLLSELAFRLGVFVRVVD